MKASLFQPQSLYFAIMEILCKLSNTRHLDVYVS
ncbi:predicted protein [Botrytis cinerea T4]|uniref:Uncharacterized protein n=1 Tax=Botryotinia fuckeliana (strain T4) TaxID=999810 RepID=G2Y5K3_BOTF4|nr:predicted protein [Botrytis cinerea T4]